MSDETPLRFLIRTARTEINTALSSISTTTAGSTTNEFAGHITRTASRMGPVVTQFRTRFPEIKQNYGSLLVLSAGISFALPTMLFRGKLPGVAVGVTVAGIAQVGLIASDMWEEKR